MQELYEHDYVSRFNMCSWFKEQIMQNPDFTRMVLFSDEAVFHTNGTVNRQNYRLWSDVNYHWHVSSKNMAAEKIVVWLGVLDTNIIGPFFFESTVNSQRYLYMLQNMMIPTLQEIGIPLYFQQDGAPPHFAIQVRNFLDFHFPNRWIGRSGPVQWAARSPDLNPLDFFMWGYLKHQVYMTQIQSVEHLMNRIIEEVDLINENQLLNTLHNFNKRIDVCIQENGGLFEHLL